MATTPGLVCAHHHLYSALARGMPAPPRTPATFAEILELVWWRLDMALDLDRLRPTLRSWEAFDRGFDACDATLEATLVDTRVIPFLEAIGVAEHSEDALDVLGHHLVVLDQRYAGSFPTDRWQEHLTRRVAGDAAQKPNDTPA